MLWRTHLLALPVAHRLPVAAPREKPNRGGLTVRRDHLVPQGQLAQQELRALVVHNSIVAVLFDVFPALTNIDYLDELCTPLNNVSFFTL